MNSQDQNPTPSDLPDDLPPDDLPPDTVAPKVRRKRSPAGVAAPVVEAAAVAAVVAAVVSDLPATLPVQAPTADEVFKPKRSRRKLVAEAPIEAAAPALAPVVAETASLPSALAAAVLSLPLPEQAGDGADAVKPAKPRKRAPAAVAALAVAAELVQVETRVVLAAPAAVPPLAAGEAVRSETETDTESGNSVSNAAETEAGDSEADGPRRRNRNRRRGRRSGADRALREDGSVADETAPRVAATGTGAGDEDDEDLADPQAAERAASMPRAAPLDAGETFAAVLSGDYDAEPADAAAGAGATAEPERRVLAAEPDAPKLHKVLAQAGIGSRRDMEELIAEGQVLVNGQPAHTGQRISFGDKIVVAGKLVKVRIAPPPPRVIAYHKPVGEVVTHDDPQNRPTVFRRLPRLQHGKWQSVGRLDINTEGLLLFTNSGELANQLMHPRFGVEREYAVRVLGTLEADAKKRLIDGVDIEGQRASFKSIEDGGGEGVNRWYRVVITEGRNREVRKLFDKVGLGVSRLIRIRYGCVVLPRGLRRGLFVDLNEAEVREVRRLAAPDRAQPGGAPTPRPLRPEGQGATAGAAPRDGQGQGQGRGNNNSNNNNNRRNGPPAQRGERPERQADGRADRPVGRGNERRERNPEQRADRPNDRPTDRQNDRQNDRPIDRLTDRPVEHDDDRDHVNFAAIPNPLMQTFDKRAIREARQPRRDIPEDGPIPNPLEQTYDKRFVQKSRGFGVGGGGGGGGAGGRKGGGGGGGAGGQPDPMKTSLGYIGADAFVRKFQGNGGGGGGGSGGGGGNHGGAGGGGSGRRSGGGGGGGGGRRSGGGGGR